MANDELFDEQGNIRPDAEIETRLMEMLQPAEEYARLGDEAAQARAQADQFEPDPEAYTEGPAMSFSGRARKDFIPEAKQRFSNYTTTADDLENRAIDQRQVAIQNNQTQNLLDTMPPHELAKYRTNDPTPYFNDDTMEEQQAAMDPMAAAIDDPATTGAGVPTGTGSELGSAKGDFSPTLDEFNRQNEALEAQQMYMEDAKNLGVMQAEENMRNLADMYAAAEEDVRSLRINPRKWEQETPAFTKALLLIGAGAFGYLTKGQGPNPLLQIIDRAIQADVDAQMKNAELNFKKGALKVNKELGMQKARTALTTALQQRAFHVFEKLNQNMKLGMEQTKYAAVMEKLALDQQLGLKKLAILNGKQAQGGGLSSKVAENASNTASISNDVMASYEQFQQLPDDVKSRWASNIWGKIPGPWETTKTSNYEKNLDAKALIIGKKIARERFTDEDRDAMKSLLPGYRDGLGLVAVKTATLLRMGLSQLRQDITMASPQERQQLLPVLEQYEERYESFVAKPEIGKILNTKEGKKLLKYYGTQADALEQTWKYRDTSGGER